MNITVLQWNVWYKEKIENVTDLLKSLNADIICLQELTINSNDQDIKDTPAYIASELGYNYYCKKIPIESTDGNKLMLANGIFSKYPIISSRFAWINQPKSEGGYDDEYRAYVEVNLDIDGKDFTVGTTHMSYTHLFKPTKNKLEESKKLMEELTKHKNNFVFTGDLNAAPDSEVIKRIESIMKSAGPVYDKKTWTTKPFSYNGFEETDLNWRLDYVFTSNDLQTKSCEILNTEFSDHLPIYTEIVIS